MMKRTLVFLLVLSLLALSACAVLPISLPTPESKPAQTQAPETQAPETQAPETQAPETQAPETQAPETQAPETQAPETEAASDAVNARGEYTDDAYVNTYLNLRIARPEGWNFYTEEQIAQVNNTTVELFEKTDLADLIAQSGQLMDMMASSVAGNSVNLILQPSQAVLENYSDEQIFQLSEETFKTQFGSAGMTVDTYEPLTMNVGGAPKTVLHLVLTTAGGTVEEYQLWYRVGGDYMGILTLALTDGSDVQPLLDGITALN